jgi:hypothetical protein
METITIIIERPVPSTGNRYAIEKRFDSETLHRQVRSLGETMENAIVEMREQLDAKEKEVRTSKPKLP